MATELRRQAAAFLQEGHFDQALPLYQKLWELPDQAARVEDGRAYGFCLQKTGQYLTGLRVARQVYRLAPDFFPNRQVYAWCIYKLEIQKTTAEIRQNPARFLRAARAIVRLTPAGKYLPTARTVFRVVAFLQSCRPYPAEAILAWLDRLDPHQLADQPAQAPPGEASAGGRPSELETWYCEKCRALFMLRRDDEFRRLAAAAQREIPCFHAENEWWLHYRLALVAGRAGNLAEKVDLLQALLPHKQDWYILNELAGALFALGRPAEAASYAGAALLEPAPPALKADLIFQLGSRLAALPGRETVAFKHYALAARLYLNAGQSLPAGLRSCLAARQVQPQDLPPADGLYLQLRGFWQQLKVEGLAAGQGIVQKMQPQGQAGWIAGEDGHAYRFEVREFLGNPTLLRPGLPVRFRIPTGSEGEQNQAIYVQYLPKSHNYHFQPISEIASKRS